ncbi:MAG TPA: UPF0182 family protein [Acidimicrobiia bacterium]
MRTSSGVPVDRRRGLFLVALGLFALYLIASALSTVWTNYLWFDSLGFAPVWWTRTLVRVALIAAGVGLSFLFLFGNLAFVDRMSLRHLSAPGTEEDELLMRVREWVEPRLRMLRLLGSAVLAVMIGGGAGAWLDQFFLFLNPQSFGKTDPLFNNDVGFYVFRLPFIRDLLVWGFNLVLITTLAVAAAHYVNGALRLRRGGGSFFGRGAKAHLSVLLAVLALLRAALYRLDAYALLYSQRSTSFFGAGYTDVNARLPAQQLLLAVAVLMAVALIINIWRQGWTFPVVAGGAWVLVAVGAGVIYPAAIERFQVVPDPLQRQSEYIAHNIDFTRTAWGLNNVEVQTFAADPAIAPEEIEGSSDAINNLRMWDPYVLAKAYSPQEFREYYGLARVDTDRYVIDGALTQVMLSVRELDESDIEDNWLRRRLSYTHGFGVVASHAARIGEDGQPNYLVSEIPPESVVAEFEITQPRIYFGEIEQEEPEPVVVRNAAGEIDYPTGPDTFASSDYEGQGGVELSSIWRRIAYGLRYRDLNLVVSPQIRADSRILMERNVRDILHRLTPFFGLDSDPYAVVVNGRVKWVVDLYTMSGDYPYATPLLRPDIDRLRRDSGIPFGINYIRNSVKAVIDAYDGDVTLYATDPSDPVLAAWRQTFPGLVTDSSEMPEGLRGHLRYPIDLFTVQTEIYREYHVTDPASFFQELDAWAIPTVGEFEGNGLPQRTDYLWGDTLPGASVTGQAIFLNEVLPYYLLMPFQGDLGYVALQSFTPRGRANMSAFMLVGSDPSGYGRLVDYRMQAGSTVNGIAQIAARIEQDPDISQQFTLWRSRGSTVIQGDITIVPIGDSLLYVQPVFLEAEGGGLPQFERVIVTYGERIEWGTSLPTVLTVLFGEDVGPDEPVEPPTDGDATALLERAEQAFADAEAALRAGDLAGYQRLVEEARALVQQALELLGSGTEASRSVARS